MALQIANPTVVGKIERLAKATGLSKTAVVEQAIDRLARETPELANPAQPLVALLARFDRIPDRPDAVNPIAWNSQGLPE